MITERSIRADMAEEDHTQAEIEDAVEAFWDAKIDQFEADNDFERAFPW